MDRRTKLVAPDELNDWVAEFTVNLTASRESGVPVLRLERMGPFAG